MSLRTELCDCAAAAAGRLTRDREVACRRTSRPARKQLEDEEERWLIADGRATCGRADIIAGGTSRTGSATSIIVQ